MPLAAVVKIMVEANSCTYGIRLDGQVVVDCNTWNDATRTFVATHFPVPEFQVGTSRGAHFYFRSGEDIPSNVKTDGVQIDFRGGV